MPSAETSSRDWPKKIFIFLSKCRPVRAYFQHIWRRYCFCWLWLVSRNVSNILPCFVACVTNQNQPNGLENYSKQMCLFLRVCCAYFARWTFCIVRALHVKFLFIHASSFSFPRVIILLAKSLYINSERSVASHIKSSCMRDSTSFLIPTPKTCLAAKRKSMNICRQKSALERACFA